jgi:AraC family transcriptional regulator
VSVPDVRIVEFPHTRVAVIEHVGPPEREHESVRRLIAWKLEHHLLDSTKYRSFGVHYTDPRTTAPEQHRVDFCLSIDREVGPNPYGVLDKVIPANRCALARDIGSRFNNQTAVWLYEQWLPRSGESVADFPIFFHYVNVGPHVRAEDMITDVYLPLAAR